MKKLLVFAAAAAMASGAAFAELKVGTVDMLVLMRNHSSYESNKKLLTDTQADSEKRVADQKKRLDAIEAEGRALADDYRNPMLSASQKAKVEEKIADVQKRYVALQTKARSDMVNDQRSLADLEASLLKTQAEDLKAKVDEFAKKNGYDLIVSSEAAVFASPALDVTKQVLEAMGVDSRKAKTREDIANEGK